MPSAFEELLCGQTTLQFVTTVKMEAAQPVLEVDS